MIEVEGSSGGGGEEAGAPIIDSHAHLDDPAFEGDRRDVLAAAEAAGVTRIINVGYRPERWRSSVALAVSYPELVVTALGVHPAHADEWSPRVAVELRETLTAAGSVAVGEAGLDRYRGGPPLDVQRRAFVAQIELAAAVDLPLIVHQRAAEAELIEVLAGAPRLPRVVLHSFEGSTRLVRFAVERGLVLGVGGLATRASSTDLRCLLGTVPIERILLETDSPYLVPRGVRARRNEPANLRTMLGSLAAMWGATESELAAATTTNARRLFRLAGKAGERGCQEVR